MQILKIDDIVSGLRFPTYALGADSPRAIVCTGKIEEVSYSDNQENCHVKIVILCGDIHLQPHETPNIDLRNNRVSIEIPWIFTTEHEADQAYVNLVAQDLQEAIAKLKEIEKRVSRIHAEYDIALRTL